MSNVLGPPSLPVVNEAIAVGSKFEVEPKLGQLTVSSFHGFTTW